MRLGEKKVATMHGASMLFPILHAGKSRLTIGITAATSSPMRSLSITSHQSALERDVEAADRQEIAAIAPDCWDGRTDHCHLPN